MYVICKSKKNNEKIKRNLQHDVGHLNVYKIAEYFLSANPSHDTIRKIIVTKTWSYAVIQTMLHFITT